MIHLDTTGRPGLLQCFIHKSGCCDFVDEGEGGEGIGQWFFPNQTSVKTMIMNGDIYSSRDGSEVKLTWNKGAVIPSGIFCCKASDPNHTFCIGVYSEGEDN